MRKSRVFYKIIIAISLWLISLYIGSKINILIDTNLAVNQVNDNIIHYQFIQKLLDGGLAVITLVIFVYVSYQTILIFNNIRRNK